MPEHSETIWRFLRGDMPAGEFESWLYATPGLEEFLGAELHFQSISVVFDRVEEVETLLRELTRHMRSLGPRPCRCLEIPDRAVLTLGFESEPLMSTFVELKRAGPPHWWLSCKRCRECGSTWLVGCDERVHDAYCLRRLDEAGADRLLQAGMWPVEFDRFEVLLQLARDARKMARFMEPLQSHALYCTVVDLAVARPGIRTGELAELLNLDLETAAVIARRAVAGEEVAIAFDPPG